MTAILSKPNETSPNTPQATFIPRDLGQIAELIQLCFEDSLDGSGRAAIREMKLLSKFGPLLWLFALLDYLGLGIAIGYVWREDKRVVGNVSIYRAGMHPHLGKGWLIANVAVHPDHRRRGIARRLVLAAIARIKANKGRWVVLQVEPDNQGAVDLYEQLNFDSFETLTFWEAKEYYRPKLEQSTVIRRRRHGEVEAEINLIYERARRGATAWTRPIAPRDIYQVPHTGVGGFRDGRTSERWVFPDPNQDGRLLGSAWVESIGLRRARITLFQDPTLSGDDALLLLRYVLNLRHVRDRHIQLETHAGSAKLNEFLSSLGFTQKRQLLQMRKLLND